MQDSVTWRELLGKIIKDPQEKHSIANESGISPLTLTRWVSGESTPRSQNLRLLLQALPSYYRKRFIELMPDEFGPLLIESLITEEAQEISVHLYTHVLKAYADLAPILRFNAISALILQEALRQLDPGFVGMEITIARCMPPTSHNKVRSLRESVGCGTPPWDRDFEQRTLFLGSETLAGYVVASGRSLAVQNRQDGENLFPARWVDWEESAMAYPIMRADHVAGCLLISCTRSDYFLSSARRSLIKCYAELLSVAFDVDNFYELHSIELGRMPPFEQQRSCVTAYYQHIEDIMGAMHISMPEAEQQAWQQIEEDLLCVMAVSGV